MHALLHLRTPTCRASTTSSGSCATARAPDGRFPMLLACTCSSIVPPASRSGSASSRTRPQSGRQSRSSRRWATTSPRTLRGKRLSVDTYEVAIHEVSDDVHAARVTTFAGDPAQVEKSLRHAVEDVLPELRTIDGWQGIIVAVDRASGAEKVITLWESEDAMSASETQADQLRSTVADSASQRIEAVQRFDVPMAFDRAPRLITV